MGLEPTTFELEVQRAIRCATAATKDYEKQFLSSPKKKKFRKKFQNFLSTHMSVTLPNQKVPKITKKSVFDMFYTEPFRDEKKIFFRNIFFKNFFFLQNVICQSCMNNPKVQNSQKKSFQYAFEFYRVL